MHRSSGIRTVGRVRSVVCCIVVATLAVSPAGAQRAPVVSLDASLGVSGHLTNDYVQEQADASLGGDLTLAIRLNRSRSGFVAAINASAYGIPVGGDSCLLAPDGGCILEQPAFALLGALAGWESPGSRVRAMGGLGFALPQWTDQPSLGIQARVDAAIPVIQYVSLIGSVRGALVPNHHHATYGLMALGIGLRLRTG
jgi:hypothetical protein